MPRARRLARAQPTAGDRPVRAATRTTSRRSSACLARGLRRVFQVAPGRVRQRLLERMPREQTAAAVYGGMPSVAHAEALLRGTSSSGSSLDEPLDALVIGVPPTTPFDAARAAEPGQCRLPRARPRPAALAKHAADRAGRHGDPRPPPATTLSATEQAPYRALFFEPHTARDPEAGARTPRSAASARRTRSTPTAPGARAIRCSRSSNGTRATSVAAGLGAVLIAGCRDAQAARQLGFVPVHGLGAALEMARGARRQPRSATCSARRTSRSSSG